MLFAAGSALDHVMDAFDLHILDEFVHLSIPLPNYHGYGLSKYSLLMLLAGGLILWIYLPLAKKIQTGAAPTGLFWNLFEFILTFIRDYVAKPYIGEHADEYVHYLWTAFLFVLTCNLLGMIPWLGSPTASFTITSVLAASVFVFIHAMSIMRFGVWNHLKAFAPHLELPIFMKVPILMMLWPIEFGGLMLKCFVLSVRLFANMFAGHIVLGTILLFIPMVKNTGLALESTVTFASVAGVLALSFLELFVAFLQAFLFAFLTALFLGGVLEHAEHAAHGHEHNHHPDPADAGPDDAHLHAKSESSGHAH
ncbi:MAG: F0F1 ATP synthase subunit A [Planctomycetes bacterium]|nr:F0F1 ATP synthase subunit A [Planctomycetota bacterium]